MLLFLLQLLFLLLGSNCHLMGKREPSFHSPLESKSIMHLAAFTWSQIPKNPENFFEPCQLLIAIRNHHLGPDWTPLGRKRFKGAIVAWRARNSTRKNANGDHLQVTGTVLS